jgi:hypothetical protein
MTKILINEAMMPMHNPNGWPERPGPFEYHDSTGEALDAAFDYRKALEKAKAEAVYFDLDNDQASFQAINNVAHFKTWKPGIFIEIDAEVEVVGQYQDEDTKQWFDAFIDYKKFHTHRLIARIKKQESQYNYTDGGYVPHATIVPINPHVAIGWTQTPPPEQSRTCEPLTFGEEMEQIRRYGQDMQRENAELKAKLEKAEERVKELENLISMVIMGTI